MNPLTLDILTYNIHKGFTIGNREFVLHQMREHLHASNSDIVFLQEIQGRHQRHQERLSDWPGASQFEFLAERIWPHFRYGKNAIYSAGHHGNAILSKFPFIHWENLNISLLRGASRSILYGVLSVPEAQVNIHVICIHLDFIAFERDRQFRVLKEWFHKNIPSGEPVILAGDFNDWRGQVSRSVTSELLMKEIFQELHGSHARTYPSMLPLLPLDRIFYRGLIPLECLCYRNHPWHKLSDHLPLHARFQVSTRGGSPNGISMSGAG